MEKGRPKDPAALSDYIHEAGSNEGWKSEFKASTVDVDYGVREAVCALANAQGGEVFVGVDDKGAVVGTPVTAQKLNATLRQGTPPAGDWFITDLLTVCPEITVVSFPSGDRWAYVIEVRPPDLPTFVGKNGGWAMVTRSGSDTLSLDGYQSILWFKQERRGTILRGCYAELSTYMGQLSVFRGLPDGLPERLPFLTNVLEDPSLSRLLTDGDRAALVGKGVNQGRMVGASDLYYKVVGRANVALKGKPHYARSIPLRDLGEGMAAEFSNLDHEIVERLAELAQYIRSQGFPVS